MARRVRGIGERVVRLSTPEGDRYLGDMIGTVIGHEEGADAVRVRWEDGRKEMVPLDHLQGVRRMGKLDREEYREYIYGLIDELQRFSKASRAQGGVFNDFQADRYDAYATAMEEMIDVINHRLEEDEEPDQAGYREALSRVVGGLNGKRVPDLEEDE